MRELTGKGEPFSFVFMSYDQGRQTSQGAITVNKAKLRPATHKDDNKNANYMLNFLDIEANQPRQLYQVCLMEFNGKRIQVV